MSNDFLPYVYQVLIQHALEWVMPRNAQLSMELIEEAWHYLEVEMAEQELEDLFAKYDELAGDRYLTKITWDNENFIVTIYDRHAPPD